jgi:hypothetical protein
MHLISFAADTSVPIAEFGSLSARSTPLAHGSGESHAYAIHIDAGGHIGPHVAGFDQLFLVVQGAGWVSGADGVRLHVPAGCGAFIRKGELHAKGSERGLVAVMVQASSFALPAPP